jgi:hypothetical protein
LLLGWRVRVGGCSATATTTTVVYAMRWAIHHNLITEHHMRSTQYIHYPKAHQAECSAATCQLVTLTAATWSRQRLAINHVYHSMLLFQLQVTSNTSPLHHRRPRPQALPLARALRQRDDRSVSCQPGHGRLASYSSLHFHLHTHICVTASSASATCQKLPSKLGAWAELVTHPI